MLHSLAPRSDSHLTSPYNIHKLFSKQVNENTQTYQMAINLLI